MRAKTLLGHTETLYRNIRTPGIFYMEQVNKSFIGRLAPLGTTQFFGVFNDNAFKIVAVLAAMEMSSSYSNDAIFLSFLTVVYVLPFLLLPVIAGFLSDRFPKRRVLFAAKFAEMLIMLLGILTMYMFDSWGIWPLVGVMFLMASQSAFFSPAFNALLPEAFPESEISRANGIIGLLTFMAVITGVGGGVLIKGLAGGNFWICGVVFSLFSLIGLVAASMAPKGIAVKKTVAWSWRLFSRSHDGFRLVFRNIPVFFAILGEAYFLAIGTALQALLMVFSKYSLHIHGDIEIGVIQLAPALGMGLGCYLAGRISANKVELGLVPYGAAGLSIFMLTTVFLPGSSILLAGLTLFPQVLLSLFFLGISGGFFVIPLKVYQQQKTDTETRGTLLANANVICFSTILAAGIIMLLLTGGEQSSISEGGGFLLFVKNICLALPPEPILAGIAALTFLVTVYSFWRLPEYAVRFAVVTLTHTIYRLSITGRENIPEKGPVLIVSNHVSFVDGLLISAASSRMVRFVIHEDYFYHPMLHWFFRWLDYIPVSDPGRPKGVKEAIMSVKNALSNGDAVCIFPEGKLTRNGVMSEFKKGYTQMIPDDMDVRIIPVHLGGVWGSIFTYYYGSPKLRIPRELPYPVTVAIGEPLPKNTEPFALRRKISEIDADSAMKPSSKERPLHSRAAKFAKRHPLK